jgi:hypothetical protein
MLTAFVGFPMYGRQILQATRLVRLNLKGYVIFQVRLLDVLEQHTQQKKQQEEEKRRAKVLIIFSFNDCLNEECFIPSNVFWIQNFLSLI